MARRFVDVRRILRNAGWVHVRTRGSHEVWRATDGRTVTIAGEDHRYVPPGTLASIRRSVELEELR